MNTAPSTKSLMVIRAMVWVATLLVAVSVFAGRHETLRDLSAGGALGMLVALCLFSVQINAVVLKDTPQAADVQHNAIS
jgi:succinate-acetate transporter protein